VLIKLSL